jgi:redox-sensing transcriptional repressor
MTRNGDRIPGATLQRLPVYLYRLKAMQDQDVHRVSSRELAAQLKIKPSQLRRDFHHFGGFSRPGQAYEVCHLVKRLQEILALTEPVDFIIAGVGNLGQAIATYTRFEADGFRLAGLFDINPKMVGLRFRDVEVMDLERMPEVVKREQVGLGIVTVPAQAAQKVTNAMVAAGIKGIWNFAPVNLQVPDDVALRDEFLSVGIMALHYRTNELARLTGNGPGSE